MRLRKNSVSGLILGGAAVYRCDKCTALNLALAAEGTLFGYKRLLSAACYAAFGLLRRSRKPSINK